MRIVKATDQKREAVIDLLRSQNLPAEDLPSVLTGFYATIEDDQLIGLIGLERYGSLGLLRSMVVHPDYRNKRIAETLVNLLEKEAIASGIRSVYLLTETADRYFIKRGYNIINRTDVPAELLASTEFSHVCPVSATVMKKEIINVSIAS